MALKPYDWQIEKAKEGYEILKKYKMVYLAFQERVGKTPTALMICEMSEVSKPILILTKKNALKGWRKFLEGMKLKKEYVLTNYHQASKYQNKEFGLVILDEAHSYLATFPKFGKIWQDVAKITRVQKLPIIYLSATPHAQGYHLIYPQFKLCVYNPFEAYKNFYHWHRHFGIPYTIFINGREVKMYDATKADLIKPIIKPYFITLTREEVGFTQEPNDKIYYITLDKSTKMLYNTLLRDRIVEVGNDLVVADSSIKLRNALYMIEGGCVYGQENPHILRNKEKVQWILDTFGDREDLAIMTHFVLERKKLQKYFKKASIFSSISHAEGVDLSNYKDLVIYSMDYSVAKFSQRRARQANINRKEPITVHYPLVKNAISEQVYNTVVKNKQNFVDRLFQKVFI